MQIDPTNINPEYTELVNSYNLINGVRKFDESFLNTNSKTFEKATAQERTNILVAENVNVTPSIKEYNLKLQANSQLSNSEQTNILFNGLKTGSTKFSKGTLQNQSTFFNNEDENNSDEINVGKGFYVVLNQDNNNSPFNSIKSHTDMMLYERIKDAYQLGFKKEPGTLVNLLF